MSEIEEGVRTGSAVESEDFMPNSEIKEGEDQIHIRNLSKTYVTEDSETVVLEDFSLGLRDYIYVLEEAVIRVCASYGILAGRLDKATGVWLEGDTPRARKICAIGVHASHFVTMHGLALNVNTDLRYFSYINPCGFVDKGVTSLQKELHREVPMAEVKERLCTELQALLDGRK